MQLGDRRVDRIEQTKDISSGGVSFLSPVEVESGSKIEYIITLSGTNPPVRIRCLGKVLRSDPQAGASGPAWEVAVSMDRYQFVRSDKEESASRLGIGQLVS
jgi:hypothetical protein